MARETNSIITYLPNFMHENLRVTHDLMASKFVAYQQNRGPIKLKDSLHFRFASSPEAVIVPVPNPLEMMIPVVEDMAVKNGIPELVSLAAEVYGELAGEQDLTDCFASQAERDFINLRDPSGVWKMLHTHTIDMETGNQCSLLLPYAYNDSGMPVFGTPVPQSARAEDAAQHGLIFALLAECRNHVLSLGA